MERDVEQQFDIEAVEAVDRVAAILGAEGNPNSAAARVVNHPLEPLAAMLGAGNFPQLLDVPPDADDEAMVELAIALSLQDHEGGADMQTLRQGFQQGFPNLQGIQSLQNLSGSALQSLQNLAAQGLVQVPNAAQVTILFLSFHKYYSDFTFGRESQYVSVIFREPGPRGRTLLRHDCFRGRFRRRGIDRRYRRQHPSHITRRASESYTFSIFRRLALLFVESMWTWINRVLVLAHIVVTLGTHFMLGW